jgi:hypothetical protein
MAAIWTPQLWTPRRGPWWRLPDLSALFTAGKVQRNSDGKRNRNGATGKIIRSTDDNEECCCEEGTISCLTHVCTAVTGGPWPVDYAFVGSGVTLCGGGACVTYPANIYGYRSGQYIANTGAYPNASACLATTSSAAGTCGWSYSVVTSALVWRSFGNTGCAGSSTDTTAISYTFSLRATNQAVFDIQLAGPFGMVLQLFHGRISPRGAPGDSYTFNNTIQAADCGTLNDRGEGFGGLPAAYGGTVTVTPCC